jgi:hypothetical protein
MNQIILPRTHRGAFRMLAFLLAAFLAPAESYLYGHTTIASERTFSAFHSVAAGPCIPSYRKTPVVPAVPVITLQPKDTTTCSGNSVSFSVTASGVIAYQWQEFISSWSNLTNTGVYSGATDSVLSLSNISGLGARQYRCIVTGTTAPSDTSNAATLLEISPPAILLQPRDTVSCSGNPSGFTIAASGSGLSYQWQIDTGTGFFNVPTGGTYLGDTSSNLTVLSVSPGMNGYRYRCIASGVCAPPINSASALLKVTLPTAIVIDGSNALICAGDSTSFTILASGESLSYQWQGDLGFGMVNLTDSIPYSGTTTSTLKITGAVAAMDGFTYQCVVSGLCGPPVTSGNPTLNVNTPPSIDYATLSPSICAGDNTSFFILTSGIVNSYQWQVSKGYGFSNLSDSLPYAGTNTQYMTLTGATADMNGYIYQCVVSGICAPPSISVWDTLYINTGPKIYFPPQDTAMCDGTSAIFAVQALGLGITFQWQEDQGNGFGFVTLPESFIYSGTTTDSLTITGINQSMDTYKYRCIVSGTCSPGDTSAAGTLYFNTSVLVYSLPVNTVVCAGSPAQFSLLATGNNITYQWQVDQGSGFTNLTNAIPYSGTTTDSLQISNTAASFDGYVYRCLVTNTCGPSDSSSIAMLNVLTAPVISLQPADTTICPGNNASLTINASGTALTYQWQVDAGGGMKNLTDTLYYTGSSTPLLSLTGAPATLDGYKYRCIVSGTCAPADSSKIALIHFNSIPSITLQPSYTTACQGANALFGIIVAGTGLTYQWQVDAGTGFVNLADTSYYSGSMSAALKISGTDTTLSGYKYRCIITGTCLPADTSAIAVLRINRPPSIASQPLASTICAGTNTLFTVAASGTGLSFQWQVNKGFGFSNLTNTGPYSGVKSDSLSVTSATTALDGYIYQCIVSGACSPSVTSANALLHIDQAPSIKTQPLSSVICESNNTAFVVSATGTGLTYQWQINQGAGFISLSDTTPYSGVSTDSLLLTAPSSSLDGTLYQCVISGTCAPSDTSAAVTLHIHSAPFIASQPADTTICNGNNASFVMTANGTSLTYQWQVNNGSGYVNLTNIPPYSGVTSASITLTGSGINLDGFIYRCIVSGSCSPADTSAGAVLHIRTAPVIASQPAASTLCIGDNGLFVVGATGNGLSYQWQVNQGSGFTDLSNSAPYSGATSSSLLVTGVGSGLDGFLYRCIVSGVCSPADTSIQVILHVKSVPKITLQPLNAAVCAGGNTSFVVGATGTGVSYQWMINTGGGFAPLSNSASYTGVTTNTLNITGANASMNGFLYTCEINYACPLPVLSNTVMLTIFSAPQIISQPSDNAACEGSVTAFTIAASGDSLTYQWQVNQGAGFSKITNNATYFGANSATLTISGASFAMNTYQYDCIIKGVCTPDLTSSPATLYIQTVPKITVQPINALACAGSMASFKVQSTGSGLSYEWQVDSGTGFVPLVNSSIYSGVATDSLIIAGIIPAMDNFKYQCIVHGLCNPVVASDTVLLRVNPVILITSQPADSTICPEANTRFSVTAAGAGLSFQWQANTGTGFTNITNGVLYTGASTSTLSVTGASAGMDGTSYQCIVSSTCSAPVISSVAVLHLYALPAITTPPADARICDGTNTVFAVSASGAALGYQWQVQTGTGFTNINNSGPYSGTTTSTLLITSASLSMNGYQYKCIVSGLCGPAAPSPIATLNIDSSPAVSIQPADAIVCDGTNAQFNLVASGAGLSYQWLLNTGAGFVNLSDNTMYAGTNTALLTVSQVNMSMNGYLYKVIVAGNCSPPANSASAVLTIHPLPSLSLISADTGICSGIQVPARSFTSIPAGATIDWANNNILIGLSSGGKAASAVPSFVAENGTSTPISGVVTVIPQLSGCYGSPSGYTIHVNPLPVVNLNLGSLNPECLNMVSVPLSGGVPTGGTYSGTTVSNGNFSPAAAGIGSFPITYTYTDSSTCSSSATAPIYVDICTGLNQTVSSDLHLDVYPNPFGHKLSIILDQDRTDVEVEIFNTSGQITAAQLFSGKILEMETNTWPAGMYYIRVLTTDGIAVRKVIKY